MIDWNARRIWLAAICLSPLVVALSFPGIGVLGSFVIVLGALFLVKETRAGTLSFVHHSVWRSVLLGIGFGVLIQLSLFFAVEPIIEGLTGSKLSLDDFAAVEGSLASYLTLLAIGLLFGGIAEELIFRGFVVGWGVRIFGERSGWFLAILSASVFGAAHMYQGIAGVLTTGLTGMLFGFFYLSLGRKLLPVIVMHMTVNLIGITQIYLGYY